MVNRKIKIAIVLGTFVVGGAENMVYELIKNIDKTMYDVCVCCYLGKCDTELEKRVRNITEIKFLSNVNGTSLKGFYSLGKVLTEFKPDIIHAHMGGTILCIPWAFFHNVPMVVTVHTAPEKAFRKKHEPFIRGMLKLDKLRLVAVSKDNHLKVAQYFNVPQDKVTKINNGIEVDRFYREEHDKFTFINVARQDENKNQIAIIKAFERIYDIYGERCQLILVGDGPCHDELISYCKNNGLSSAVMFTGNISDTERFYAKSDVYVQASYREGLPLSVLEAMAAGLPILSNDVGGLKDVVKKNGFLISDNSIDVLYDCMKRCVIEQQENLRRMGRYSKELVEQYSSKQMGKQYMILYKKTLKEDNK